jgi:hypothetical protein
VSRATGVRSVTAATIEQTRTRQPGAAARAVGRSGTAIEQFFGVFRLSSHGLIGSLPSGGILASRSPSNPAWLNGWGSSARGSYTHAIEPGAVKLGSWGCNLASLAVLLAPMPAAVPNSELCDEWRDGAAFSRDSQAVD